MDNEKKIISESGNEGVNTETEFDPISAINDIKANTVSKEEYNKLKAEKDKYLKALIEGSQVADEKKETVDIDALRKELFNPDNELSNLDYVKKSLQLREAIIDTEGKDIFVGSGSKLVPTQEDYEAAQRLADGFQYCIDVADGNSEIFTRELARITNDVSLPSRINPKIRR